MDLLGLLARLREVIGCLHPQPGIRGAAERFLQANNHLRGDRRLFVYHVIQRLPGQTKRLFMTVRARDLAYFNSRSGTWEVEALSGTILVGPSSHNLPLSASFRITENTGT